MQRMLGCKIFSPEGLPTCSECGLIEDRYVDDTAEWTSGMNDDGKVNDPSRCGNPNANPELFSQNWGKGTIISTQHGSLRTRIKRMAKINFHMSMNHKDRSLFHAYKDIDEACHTLPDVVLKDAKMMYRKFNEEKLTRCSAFGHQSKLRFIRVSPRETPEDNEGNFGYVWNPIKGCKSYDPNI